ncbi:MAG: hypothetical protein JKY65_28410 [Planctomycetes bacterium]|nr:hypothetical protein [Planctomycetota bacterium]
MPDTPAHTNADIQAACLAAVAADWRFFKAGPRAHAYGRLFCPANARGGCIVSVYGTPGNPRGHARHILRMVAACAHEPAGEA